MHWNEIQYKINYKISDGFKMQEIEAHFVRRFDSIRIKSIRLDITANYMCVKAILKRLHAKYKYC